MKILSVVGARPQFIKAATVSKAFLENGLDEVLVHTGQHYDFAMSALFFDQLSIPHPQHNLGVGSGSHGAQTGQILEGIEKILLKDPVDCVLVYGDTNSTLAGALAASKLHIPVAHVEAGLRSFNRRMPEEINRVLTDHVSDWLFVPTPAARVNLRSEGIADEKVHVVGDVMYDAALQYKPYYEPLLDGLLAGGDLKAGGYYVATVHRAENTDDDVILRNIISGLNRVAAELAPVIWPLHPRTRHKMASMELSLNENLRLIEPVGYLEMQAYLSAARGVLTDSGGVQKEASFHGVSTVTLRNETEWPETIDAGCNRLVGTDAGLIFEAGQECHGRGVACNAFGAGNSAQLIARILRAKLSKPCLANGPHSDD